jgi:hypothetical protein
MASVVRQSESLTNRRDRNLLEGAFEETGAEVDDRDGSHDALG